MSVKPPIRTKYHIHEKKINQLPSARSFFTLALVLISITSWKQAVSQYCDATNTDCGFEYITNLSVSNVNNTTDCGAPYDDYTAQIINMQEGQSYPGTVSKNATFQNYFVTIFIDWDQSETFEATEEVSGTLDATFQTFNFTITPPAGAILGETRMRVRMIQNGAPAACGTAARGDIEDYTVNLTAAGGAPANNACIDALTVTPSTSCVTMAGSTVNATQQFAPSDCDGNTAADANDVWFTFTANGTSAYVINATGTGGMDPVLEYFDGCSAASSLGCADATILNGDESIDVGTLAAGTYYYRIYGNGGDGTYTTCVVEDDNSDQPIVQLQILIVDSNISLM